MGILIFKTDKTKWQKMLIALLGLFFLTTAIAGGNMNFRSGKNDSDVSRLAHAKALESKLIGEEGSKSKQSNSFERLRIKKEIGINLKSYIMNQKIFMGRYML